MGRSRTRGSVHFPATLFGLPHNTSRGARRLTAAVIHGFTVIPLFTHPRAALYGTSSNTPFFIVAVSELSAAARKYGATASAAALRRGLLVMGSADAQGFSAGRGVKQACGHLRRSGTTLALCVQYGKAAAGLALYFNGAVSSLGDAAAKTNQAISASGG